MIDFYKPEAITLLFQLLIPIHRYLEPDETDIALVRLYYQSLLGVTLRPLWAPVLYLIAVHHINRFVFTQDGQHTKLKASMIKQVYKSENQVSTNWQVTQSWKYLPTNVPHCIQVYLLDQVVTLSTCQTLVLILPLCRSLHSLSHASNLWALLWPCALFFYLN